MHTTEVKQSYMESHFLNLLVSLVLKRTYFMWDQSWNNINL